SEEANDDDYNDEPGYYQASEPPKSMDDQVFERNDFDEDEPIEVVHNSQLNDTDLDFQVNIQRKTLLLANESNLPRALSTVEMPPDILSHLQNRS
ncbi:23088_t:CDS:1, partial [Racocetra persica]